MDLCKLRDTDDNLPRHAVRTVALRFFQNASDLSEISIISECSHVFRWVTLTERFSPVKHFPEGLEREIDICIPLKSRICQCLQWKRKDADLTFDK